MTIFPDNMMSKSKEGFTIESIASKLTYFQEQLHLIHWQTSNYAEHKAIGDLYEFVQDFKDDVIEKLMGYMSRKPKAFKLEQIQDNVNSKMITEEFSSFAYDLYEWAGQNDYCDIENMAQDLSGKIARTLYLLTLS